MKQLECKNLAGLWGVALAITTPTGHRLVPSGEAILINGTLRVGGLISSM